MEPANHTTGTAVPLGKPAAPLELRSRWQMVVITKPVRTVRQYARWHRGVSSTSTRMCCVPQRLQWPIRNTSDDAAFHESLRRVSSTDACVMPYQNWMPDIWTQATRGPINFRSVEQEIVLLEELVPLVQQCRNFAAPIAMPTMLSMYTKRCGLPCDKLVWCGEHEQKSCHSCLSGPVEPAVTWASWRAACPWARKSDHVQPIARRAHAGYTNEVAFQPVRPSF